MNILQWNKRLFVLLILLTGALLFLYRPAFEWLIRIWWNDNDYSHGFLVIPICIYLTYILRHRIQSLCPRPRLALGGLLIFASGVLLLAGRAGGVALAEAVSFLALVPGVVLFVWGWGALKAYALPVAYLQFMVPWMEEFTNRIHGPFQLLSAHIGVWIMKVIGLVVYHEGKFIMLPNITLEVARECSGVRYLTSILAIGIPLVYLTQRSWWRSTGVIVSGIMITLLANGFRVAIIGYLTHQYGVGLSHGPSHVFQGWFAAQVGFIALFLVNWGMTKIPSGSNVRLCDRWTGSDLRRNDEKQYAAPIFRHFLALFVFLFSLGAYIHLYGIPRLTPPRQSLAGFPLRVVEWSGRDDAWIPGDIFFPGADAEIIRIYRNKEGREVYLYIAYFESQRQGKSLISIRSNPLREKDREVQLFIPQPAPKMANRSFPTINRMRYSALFWYKFPTGETTGRLPTKLKGVTDALLYRENGGAFIMVAIPLLMREEKKEEIPADLIAFVRDVSPVLLDYLP